MADAKLDFDVAWALDQGRRETQEDAIAVEFPSGAGHGIVVLADGLGGHAAGEVASRVVVDEVFGELKSFCADNRRKRSEIPATLCQAARTANERLRLRLEADISLEGMGSTLVGLIQLREALYWVSVGDSVLYLFRGGTLSRLNSDHSLAPHIDLMVKSGAMSAEEGNMHPYRNCLTSALTGGKIAEMDCPDTPHVLSAGDIVVAASDGLQFLSEAAISRLLAENKDRASEVIAQIILDAISELDDPGQDNVCFSIVKACDRLPDVRDVADSAHARTASTLAAD